MRTNDNRTEAMVPNALNALLSVALLMMPWYLGLGSETAGAGNAPVCGLAIASIAVLAHSRSYDWEPYINLAVCP